MPDQVLLAAGYTRVSMGEQLKGHSLDAQAAHIQAYVNAHGWRLVEVYTDAGISAKQGSKRPGFEHLLADARAGRFNVVIVDKIDRFSRHLGSLLTALEQLNSANVAFVSVQEHLDLTTPWGKLMLTVLGMLAEIYIDNLRQETRKGKKQRARDGLWNGNVPFGYCKGLCSQCTDPNGGGPEGHNYCPNFGQPNLGDGKLLIPHPIESKAVRLAFEWYITGKFSDGQITDKLNAQPFLLADGSSVHFRTKGIPNRYPPGPLTKDAVRELLQRRFYVGQIVYRSFDEQGKRRRRTNITETFQGKQPPLIDQATFDKAQELRQDFGCSPRFQYSKPAEIYPLSGLIRCASCGLPMRAFSSHARRYYQDVTRIEHRGQCDQLSVRADEIEDQVADYLNQVRLPDDWQTNARQWLGAEEAQNHTLLVQQRWARVKELFLRGDIGREEFEAEKQAVDSLKNWDLTNRKFDATMTAGEIVRNLAQSWARALPIEKKKLLRLMLSAVFVRGNALVAVQPTPALFPLMSRFVGDLYCSCGDDGIRTRGLCLDRAAC